MNAEPDPLRVHFSRLTPGDAAQLLAGVVRSRRLHHPWVAPPDTLEAMRGFWAFQNGFLGFHALSPHEGRGCMPAGLAEVVDLAFDEHGLHRLEANVQPGNHRSAGLVRALGF